MMFIVWNLRKIPIDVYLNRVTEKIRIEFKKSVHYDNCRMAIIHNPNFIDLKIYKVKYMYHTYPSHEDVIEYLLKIRQKDTILIVDEEEILDMYLKYSEFKSILHLRKDFTFSQIRGKFSINLDTRIKIKKIDR